MASPADVRQAALGEQGGLPMGASGDLKEPHGPPGLRSGRLTGAGLGQPRASGAGSQGVSGTPTVVSAPGREGDGCHSGDP